MADEKKGAAASTSTTTKAPAAAAVDFAGNPAGTTYNEQGLAIAPEGTNPKLELKNLPQDAEGKTMYNPDGTIFSIPSDAATRTQTMKTDIKGLEVAITRGEQKVAAATEMMTDADEADKPIFEKNIASQKAAIESNKAAKAAKEAELREFLLSMITPSQRVTERQLAQAYIDRDKILEQIKDLENKKKAWSVTDTQLAGTKPPTEAPLATEEQIANRKKLIEENGTQGKAIVSLLKQGWTNTQIYKHMGIPAASVPGPKNAWLGSAEGIAFVAANPGLVK